jgi:hypothetical protein
MKVFLYQLHIPSTHHVQPNAEGKMTPKVLSIVDKYKGTCSNMTEVANSSCSGDGGQTTSSKRKRLKEALSEVRNECQVRNLEQNWCVRIIKCHLQFWHLAIQELDKICNVCEWMLPRYAILPLVSDGIHKYLLLSPYFSAWTSIGSLDHMSIRIKDIIQVGLVPHTFWLTFIEFSPYSSP